MEDLNRLKQLSGIRAKEKNVQQLNELNEAPKRQAAPTAPAPGPSQGYDDSPLGALRQYDAAKAAGTLPPVTRAPSAPSPSPSGGSAPVKVVPTKGGDYPVYAKSSPEAGSFRDAFAAARAQQGAGGTFQWQGRSYSTNRADDAPSAPKVTPLSDFNKGSSVPRAGAGMPAQPAAIGPSTGPTSRFGDPTSAPQTQLPPQPMNRTGVAPDSSPTANAPNAPSVNIPKQTPGSDAGEKPALPPKTPNDSGFVAPQGGSQFKSTVGDFQNMKLGLPSGVPSAGAGMPAQGYARPAAAAPGDMGFKSDLLSKQAKGDFSEEELEENFRTAYEAAMAEADLTTTFGGGIKPLSADEIAKQAGTYTGKTTDVTSVPPGAYTNDKGQSFQDRVNAAADNTPIDLKNPKDNRPYTLAPPPDSIKLDKPGSAPQAPATGSAGPAVGTDSDGNRIIPYRPVPKDSIIQYEPSNNPFATKMEKDAYWAQYKLQKGLKPEKHEQDALDAIDAHRAKNKINYESDMSAIRRLAGLGETDLTDEGNEFSGELAKARAAHKDEFEVDGKTYKVKEDAKPDYLDMDKDGDKKEPMKKALKDKEKTDEAAKPDFLDVDKDGDKEEAMKKALKDKQRSDEALEKLKMAAGIW